LLADVPAPLMLLWAAAHAAMDGEHAFPEGYNLIPTNRIAHCHCRDVVKNPVGRSADWAALGVGSIDRAGQFRALKVGGYSGAISPETHWRGRVLRKHRPVRFGLEKGPLIRRRRTEDIAVLKNAL
jgi:sugar phosphate isomerase/epimerase